LKSCSVLIVGAGVTGTALAYTLSRFTNVKDILLIEKNSKVAQVNSHPLNNAQTSHDGSTETNYDLPHALKVKKAATALRRYIEAKHDQTLSRKVRRMVIAITPEEISKLKQRYSEFKPYYPDLWLAYHPKLEEIEPNLMKGRPSHTIMAMGSDEGHIVNYQELARRFVDDTCNINPEFKIRFNCGVEKIYRMTNNRAEFAGYYGIRTTDGNIFTADIVIFAAGPYSLYFAQKLGYGLVYGLLSVAGSFYDTGNWLNNKVYRMQVEGRPFAEIHGDPDILDMTKTRFGPTTKVLPLMERHHYNTFKDFMELPLLRTVRGVASLLKILWKRRLIWYVAKNILFDIPLIGRWLFLQEVKKVIPAMRFSNLKLRKGAGGIRPQIVNLKTMDLEMGDSSIVGDNIIFNTTPSPGASVCLGNAHRDAGRIVAFLNKAGGNFYFNEMKFREELGEAKAHS
jgi:malate dehydrogenase (quinone)